MGDQVDRDVRRGATHDASMDETFQGIAARAAAADRGEIDLGADLQALQRSGLLRAPLPPRHGGRGLATSRPGLGEALRVLRCLGRANLSVARLYEGHVNAIKLLDLYASAQTCEGVFSRVRGGLLLGVWGADGDAPVTLQQSDGAFLLTGGKRFASGLGLVGEAVIPARTEAGPQLLLAPVDTPSRADGSTWTVSGMKPTASGSYAFEGLRLEPTAVVGKPGDFLREPHFEGGVWRYSAAHLGGAESLYDLMLDRLITSARAANPHQEVRIAHAAIACETARLWIERAAGRVEGGGGDAEAAAAYALLAREVTEAACLSVIDLTERALGMAAFDTTGPIERIRRDLSLFLRQAAPDDKRARAARALTERRTRAEAL